MLFNQGGTAECPFVPEAKGFFVIRYFIERRGG
jgi:hypothetical protein